MFNIKKINALIISHTHQILALMLISLHAFLVFHSEAYPFNRAFFLCSYGLFLMWQPIWRSSEKLSASSIMVLLGTAWLAYYFVNWWLIAIWLSLLLGLLGGRILSEDSKRNQIVHILAASYLLAMLLLWVVPKLLNASGDLEAANFTIMYLLPLLPVGILFLNNTPVNKSQLPIIDFFYTLIITLIAMLLVLASYAVGNQNQVNYIEVMFTSIFAIAFTLIAFSFLWKPSTRFSGVELMMSRYLSSVGMPFEQWVRNIANLGEIESNAHSFLQGAMQEMTSLPWISGVSWVADESDGSIGEKSTYSNNFNFKDLHMTLHSRWQVSPALYVHVKLLTQIMGEFYEAKRREETLRQNAYMQAFYESGSRLTHDIKNILQAVGTLVKAAEQTKEADNAKLLGLVRRQLPMLNQRITGTLDKLKAPGEEKKRVEKMTAWWKALQLRNQQKNIEFSAETLPAIDINAEVLDSILDNLISNATEKAKHETDIRIKVEISQPEENSLCIEVVDSGKSIPPNVSKDLFKKHISSQNGMGVGLYHAALDAKQAGYALSVANNIDTEVRFRLQFSASQ